MPKHSFFCCRDPPLWSEIEKISTGGKENAGLLDKRLRCQQRPRGIVYRFADGSETEISLAEYLQANPDKTEQDFIELKALSDDIYYEQALEDTRYGKQKQSLGKLEDSEQFATPAIDILLIHNSEKGQALKAARLLLESGELTEVQRRRFIKHYFEGKSYRKIATRENVHFTSVQESIEAATNKLQKYFKKI